MKNNYKNDVFTGNRKYQMVDNGDGTFSFVDVTVYSQVGDTFAALDINNIATEFNNHNHNTLYYGKTQVDEAIAASVYTHPVDNGYYHLPSGGTSGKFLRSVGGGQGEWTALGHIVSVTLPASGWSTTAPYQQTVSVANVRSDIVVFFDVADNADLTQYESASWAMLKLTNVGFGNVIVKAFGEKPTIDIPVKFLITG